MATITIRNLDDDVYERLKTEARANHRSLEAEARARLEGPRRSRAELLERLRASQIIPGPDYPGSVAEIRAIRDEE
jgi:plasmid stability protein